MKKLYLDLKSFLKTVAMFLSLIIVFCSNVFAADFGEIFQKLGGWQVVIVIACFLIIWIIRATKTQKDDEILDKYVSRAVEYAVNIMPKDSKIDWVKFVANALGKFNEIYTKTNELPPDAKLYEKAKQLIEKIAELKQIEQTKVA